MLPYSIRHFTLFVTLFCWSPYPTCDTVKWPCIPRPHARDEPNSSHTNTGPPHSAMQARRPVPIPRRRTGKKVSDGAAHRRKRAPPLEAQREQPKPGRISIKGNRPGPRRPRRAVRCSKEPKARHPHATNTPPYDHKLCSHQIPPEGQPIGQSQKPPQLEKY